MVMTEPKRTVHTLREAGDRSHYAHKDRSHYAHKESSERVKTAFEGSNDLSNEAPSKAKIHAP